MNIDRVIECVQKKQYELITKKEDPYYVPKLAIYMDYDFYIECKKEIQGGVSFGSLEFVTDDAVMGCPVWVARPRREKGKQIQHESFVIANLDT